MYSLVLNLPQRITHLVKRQSEAITELLRTQSANRGSEAADQTVTDAQQEVIDIAKVIALALEPASSR
jgi:hypothetical protein